MNLLPQSLRDSSLAQLAKAEPHPKPPSPREVAA